MRIETVAKPYNIDRRKLAFEHLGLRLEHSEPPSAQFACGSWRSRIKPDEPLAAAADWQRVELNAVGWVSARVRMGAGTFEPGNGPGFTCVRAYRNARTCSEHIGIFHWPLPGRVQFGLQVYQCLFN